MQREGFQKDPGLNLEIPGFAFLGQLGKHRREAFDGPCWALQSDGGDFQERKQ